ncbi:ankyrin repeat protein, partial [Colletotrichum plurivorum]
SIGGHFEVVKVLLEKGADVSVADNHGFTPLFAASNGGHFEVVKVLLEKGADVSVADNNGWTPLNAASIGGHFEVVKVLLEEGADVSVADNNGWTPLTSASNGGHLEVVKVLLEKGADVSVADNNGWTPLTSASNGGHLEVVKALLKKGADVSVANNNGWTPLFAASNGGHLEVVKVLLEKGADVSVADNNGWTPLTSASNGGHLEVVKVLLEKGADVSVADNNGWTPLYTASNSGHLEVVKVLLEKGADVSVATHHGFTPLNAASNGGHLEVVKVLLEKGADISVANNDGWTPLNVASNGGHLEVVKVLLKKGADVSVANNNGWTPLFAASNGGHLEVVKVLLEKGADVSVANKDGWTPLYTASNGGHLEVVKVLTSRVDLDTKHPRYGQTALSYASEGGHEPVVQFLLANDHVTPCSMDHINRTPLFWASKGGHDAIVQALLNREPAALDWKDRYGSTPLSAAARHGHVNVVKSLLATEAVSINSRDQFGRTPLWWARRHGHSEVSQLLLESGKKRDISLDVDQTVPEGKINVIDLAYYYEQSKLKKELRVKLNSDALSSLYSHVGAVVVTWSLCAVWETIQDRGIFSRSVRVIGGGRIADGYIITPQTKAAVVFQLRDHHGLYVWAFGDSPRDLPMFKLADEAVVVVGVERFRSKCMNAALLTAVGEEGLRARQGPVPNTVRPHLSLDKLPLVDVSNQRFIDSVARRRRLRVLYERRVHWDAGAGDLSTEPTLVRLAFFRYQSQHRYTLFQRLNDTNCTSPVEALDVGKHELDDGKALLKNLALEQLSGALLRHRELPQVLLRNLEFRRGASGQERSQLAAVRYTSIEAFKGQEVRQHTLGDVATTSDARSSHGRHLRQDSSDDRRASREGRRHELVGHRYAPAVPDDADVVDATPGQVCRGWNRYQTTPVEHDGERFEVGKEAEDLAERFSRLTRRQDVEHPDRRDACDVLEDPERKGVGKDGAEDDWDGMMAPLLASAKSGGCPGCTWSIRREERASWLEHAGGVTRSHQRRIQAAAACSGAPPRYDTIAGWKDGPDADDVALLPGLVVRRPLWWVVFYIRTGWGDVLFAGVYLGTARTANGWARIAAGLGPGRLVDWTKAVFCPELCWEKKRKKKEGLGEEEKEECGREGDGVGADVGEGATLGIEGGG